MTDETDAYAVKINGVYFVSMNAAKDIVDEARQDGWNLALEEAAKVADRMSDEWVAEWRRTLKIDQHMG